MLKQFLNHIDQNNLFTKAGKILLAVSGGLDSMVMLHLFKEAGFNVGVAHCNFQLRDEESKGDEALVNMTCLENGIPFHSIRFETLQYANDKKLSIQMAARELRYNFFDEICKEHQYQYVATAHHINDSIETILLNLVRGTGLDGLTGIAKSNARVVRPLLFAARTELEEYATFLRLKWREDSSNSENKYARNLLRNEVIPLLKKINPSLEKSMEATLARLEGSSSIQKEFLDKFRNTSVHESFDQVSINKSDLLNLPSQAVCLWELLKDKGFNFEQCKEVVSVEHQSGKTFQSATHQLTIDRQSFIITLIQEDINLRIQIDKSDTSVSCGSFTLRFEIKDGAEFKMEVDDSLAQLDYDKLCYPLVWRGWKEGDSFIPLGMTHHKKLSDFLIDIKLPLPEKEKVTVLESNGEIVWVIGYRISNSVKLTDKTKQILVIKNV